MALEANKETVVTFFRRLDAGDVDGAFALFVDGARWGSPRVAADGRQVDRSCEDEADLVRQLLARVDGRMGFEILTLTAEDDRVAAVVRSDARLAGGGAYRNRYHFLFEVADGRLLGVAEFSDTLRIVEALAPPGGLGVP